MRQKIFLDGFHAFLVERAGVLDGLLSDAAKTRIRSGIVRVRSLGVEDTARAELRVELGAFRVVRILRLLLGVEVIEVAVELVEAVACGQELVAVAEMVLADLRGSVALRL